MVQAWIEIHKDELFADRELAVSGEQPFPIGPLRQAQAALHSVAAVEMPLPDLSISQVAKVIGIL